MLIEEIKKLTVSSNVLINKLDKKADKVIAENAITGELEMEFDATYSENQKVFIIFGGATMEESIKGIGPLISVGNLHPLNAKIRNNKLLISMKVYDMNENLLAEIEDNNWRPNKNFTGKFNYDKKGFEIIDNQGNIAANFDILGPNKIKIQGIFPYKEAGRILIAGDSLLQNPPFGTKEIEDLVLKKTGKKYDIFLKEIGERLMNSLEIARVHGSGTSAHPYWIREADSRPFARRLGSSEILVPADRNRNHAL